MSLQLEIAIEAAKLGAVEALKSYGNNLDVELKDDNSIVTEVDTRVEKIIKKFILRQDKNADFIAEESNHDKTLKEFWVIDPIDGSRAFSHNTPFWCTLIARFVDNTPVVGVCNFPLLGGILYAEIEKGAFLEGRKVEVSKVDKIKSAFFSFGSLKRFKDKSGVIRLVEATASTRAPAPTYSNYLIAQGKVDICVDAYAEIWDRAPFQVIIPEAGGRITNIKGEELSKNDRGCIVSNGILHKQVLEIYNNE